MSGISSLNNYMCILLSLIELAISYSVECLSLVGASMGQYETGKGNKEVRSGSSGEAIIIYD